MVHVLSFAIVFGGLYFNVRFNNHLYYAIVYLSGFSIMIREIYKNGIWVFQIRGILTILKIGLLLILVITDNLIFPLILIIAMIGILCSHLPKRIRKKTLLVSEQTE